MEREPLEPEEVYKLPDLPALEKEAFVKVSCPSCATEARAADLNINDKIGKCGNCHVVYSFAHSLPQPLLGITNEDEIARPEGIDLIRFKDEMELTLEQPASILDITIACLAPLIIFIMGAIYFKNGQDWAMIPGIITSLIFANSIFRMIRAKYKNIFVTLDKKFIYIQWRPKQFKKDKKYPIEDIEQLYVKNTANGITLYMIVNGINGQRHEELLGRFPDHIKAKYVEQEIERYLEIENKKVSGEV